MTDGLGVDLVVEVGGAGTLERSLCVARLNGFIGTIGVLTGIEASGLSLVRVFSNQLRVQGIYVGSREMFKAMNTAITQHHLKPVIHEVIPFPQARRAYELLESGKHFGKIVISHD